MSTVGQPVDWKAITPQPLQKAVSRIRDRFEEKAVAGCRTMERECYPEIHQVPVGTTEMTVYERHFRACVRLLEVPNRFSDLLSIAEKHAASLGHDAMDWAQAQMQTLIEETAVWAERWLRSACDQQYSTLRNDTPRYFELFDQRWPRDYKENRGSPHWLAPRCTSMGLFAPHAYDRQTAWSRDDRPRTEHVLAAARYLFVRECSIDLERAIGDAYVRLAQENASSIATLIESTARATETQSENGTNKRDAFVRPLLNKKGWSIHDWAVNSNVDFHTAASYLKGKTKTYQSTRKKLADSLGVLVEDLPY